MIDSGRRSFNVMSGKKGGGRFHTYTSILGSVPVPVSYTQVLDEILTCILTTARVEVFLQYAREL